jgi:hypothetical protein
MPQRLAPRAFPIGARVTRTFERARVNAESKRVYLATFVPPLLPHDVSWPQHRLLIALLGAAAVAATYWLVTRTGRACIRLSDLKFSRRRPRPRQMPIDPKLEVLQANGHAFKAPQGLASRSQRPVDPVSLDPRSVLSCRPLPSGPPLGTN